jgi:hypothetical protein
LISPAAIPVTFWNVTGLRPTLITQTIPSKRFSFYFFFPLRLILLLLILDCIEQRTGAIYTSFKTRTREKKK